jgi:Protein of unknown function (DUF2637)
MTDPTTTPRPPLRERFAAWCRRWFRRALGMTIAAVAAIWSFDTLTDLGHEMGFGGLSWMFPLCIDAVAALGMDYWMTRSPAWRLGRAMALTAIAVSIAGNVADWVLRGTPWYTALFGTIPPAALAATLGIMHRNARGEADLIAWLNAEQAWLTEQADARQAAADRKAQAKAERVAKPKVVEQPNVRQLAPAKSSDDATVLAKIREHVERTGVVPSKRDVMEQYRVGSGKALRLTREVRETVTTETVETGEETG